ncbi:hypothetical protein GCM10010211_61730 [Streptomyces albospinus]|uniref:Secreted protein n=1 Tax=Streptomyces albospinus TaxID=285515 RepID=A0ABQ2VJR9_9ACTN|nr:hypothetical protein [Streptomyces albospinus]GGU87171.1 hypothetical protein GCM10010211_61730 [Streptomyces albospinus]
MRRHLRILTVSAVFTLLTFGLAAPAQAGGSGGKSPLTSVLISVPVVGHLLDGLGG